MIETQAAVLESGQFEMPSRASIRIRVDEIRQRLDVSKESVYALLESGDIPAIRPQRNWIISRSAYLEWEQTIGQGRHSAA